MVANVLKSDRAIEVSIEVIEAFVRLKHAILDQVELSKRIAAIESRLDGHDDQFKVFQELILPLLSVSQTTKRRIGFERV